MSLSMRRVFPAALSLSLLLAVGPASAEQSQAQRAQPHVDAGQAAFNAENYEEALREFLAAREIIDEPLITYNIALCQERLGHLREAIDEYNRYLREAPEARNADAVRNKIEELHRQRVEERDAEVEVEAADTAQRESRRGQRREFGRFGVAHHELDVQLGAAVVLANGLRGGAEAGGGGSTGLALEFDYYYRINETWHVGVGGLFESFYQGEEVTAGSNQRHFGGAFNGRWSHLYVDDHLEVRAVASLGYEFINKQTLDAHWIFLRMAGEVGYAIWHGFGVLLRLGFRFGFLAGGDDNVSSFGGTFDATAGVFWAF